MKYLSLIRERTRAFALLIVAFMLAAFAMSAAFALQVDQTRIMSKRDLSLQAMHYYRLTINYNDANISTPQKFGALGSNWYIYAIDCHVTTAFNATTNTIVMGYDTIQSNQIIASGTLNAGSATVQHLTSAAGLGLTATSGGDITLYTKYTQAGSTASAGSVTCVISYVPNNDM